MNEIINYVLIFTLILCGFLLLRFVLKRLILLARLATLKRIAEAKIKLHTFPLRPMWMMKSMPDITVKILDTEYRIRLYSGGGVSKSVHFNDRSWSVVYSKLSTATVSPRRRGAKYLTVSSLNVGARVIYLPDMPRVDSQGVIDVLLFNPAPAEVSYVTEEGNSIKLAFTGDELQGYMVFTGSTFIRYAERRYREEKEKILSAKYY